MIYNLCHCLYTKLCCPINLQHCTTSCTNNEYCTGDLQLSTMHQLPTLYHTPAGFTCCFHPPTLSCAFHQHSLLHISSGLFPPLHVFHLLTPPCTFSPAHSLFHVSAAFHPHGHSLHRPDASVMSVTATMFPILHPTTAVNGCSFCTLSATHQS